MSGPVRRQQLGSTMKRLRGQITETRTLCEEELIDEHLERLLKDVRKVEGRILKNLETYKNLHQQLMQVAQTDKEEEKKLITEGDEHAQLILEGNEITSDSHVLAEEIEQKLVKLEKAIPKVETETKPSTLEKQLEKLLQLEEKHLLKSEALESASLKFQTSSVNLPKLDFEKYSGDLSRFQEFWDSFFSAVHESKRLRPVEKLNYLRAKLEGNAKRAIAGLEITNDNYEVAVKFFAIDSVTLRL